MEEEGSAALTEAAAADLEEEDEVDLAAEGDGVEEDFISRRAKCMDFNSKSFSFL